MITDPDPAPDPALWSVTFKTPREKLFAYYFLKVHLHHSQKSHRRIEIKVFLNIRICTSDERIRIREAQKLTDPPDPEYLLL